MQRRQLLKGAAGIGATATLGGIGLLAMTGPAAASSLDISDADPVSTDTGEVSYVRVQLEHTASWDGFDVPVQAVAYTDRVIVEPNGAADSFTVYDNTSQPVMLENWSSDGSGSDGWGGSGEYTSGPGTAGTVDANIDWNVLADDAGARSVETPGDLSSTTIEPGTDGETNQTGVRYKKEVTFYTEDASGSVTAEDGTQLRKMGDADGTVASTTATGSFVVEVTNQAAGDDSGGSGSSSVGT